MQEGRCGQKYFAEIVQVIEIARKNLCKGGKRGESVYALSFVILGLDPRIHAVRLMNKT
jgi:hypothetical protein